MNLLVIGEVCELYHVRQDFVSQSFSLNIDIEIFDRYYGLKLQC